MSKTIERRLAKLEKELGTGLKIPLEIRHRATLPTDLMTLRRVFGLSILALEEMQILYPDMEDWKSALLVIRELLKQEKQEA